MTSGTLYDQGVDVYAYGVLPYRLFTPNMDLEGGRATRGVQQMVVRILRVARFRPVPEIPAAFWELVQRYWAQLPAERPSFKDIAELLQTNNKLILTGYGRVPKAAGADSLKFGLRECARGWSVADEVAEWTNRTWRARICETCGTGDHRKSESAAFGWEGPPI
jgi:hypothetical protein